MPGQEKIVMSQKCNVIYLDYETSPQLGYFFGNSYDTQIIKVKEHEQILSASYAFNDGAVHVIGQCDFKGYKPGVLNDKELVKFISEQINKADFTIAHNGDQFDNRVLNSRLAFHGLPPVSTKKSLDTKKIAKKLHLPSNRLNDIAQFFGIGEKMHHAGIEMWFGCMEGDPKYWNMMKKYDKQDTVLLRKIAKKLMPFSTQINDFIRVNNLDVNCSNVLCGSKNLTKSKLRRVAGGFKQQYQCRDCGRYTQDTKFAKV